MHPNSLVGGELPMKWCSTCKLDRPLTDFDKCTRAKDGLAWKCRPCRREYLDANSAAVSERMRLYREANPDKTRAKAPSVGRVPVEKRLSPAQYDAALLAQGGVCAICEQPEVITNKQGKLRRLAVDHDHTTHELRGLLCFRCNVGLGSFRDDAHLLEQAIGYLAEHATGSAGPFARGRLVPGNACTEITGGRR